MTKLESLYKDLEAARMEHDAASKHADTQLEHITDLEKQIVQEEKRVNDLKGLYEAAHQLKAVHNSFIEAGFTEAQAFSLVKTMLHSAMAPDAPVLTHSTPEMLIRALLA